MDFQTLNTFIQVAQIGNFTKAANILGYSQSSVSAQIKQLENEIGAPLFDRINHKIALTAKGQETLKFAYQIDSMLRNLKNSEILNEDLEGTVRINAGESAAIYMLTKGFCQFHKQYPNIHLRLVESRIDDLLEGLNYNLADFVISVGERFFNSEYIIAHEEKLNMSFIAGKGSPYDTKESLTIHDIIHSPFILPEYNMGYRLLMDRKLNAMSIEIDPVLEMGNTDLICQLVAQGNGISYLPDYAIQKTLAAGTIVCLNVVDFEIDAWEQVLYHKNKWISPTLDATLRFFSKPLSLF